MSDSSDDDGLFGDDDQDENLEAIERMNASDPPPAYTKSPEFEKFVQQEGVIVNQKFGFIYIHTYKPFYFPGETVRGSVVIDLFNNLPKNYKKFKIRFSGREHVGKKSYDKVNRSLKSQQKITTLNMGSKLNSEKIQSSDEEEEEKIGSQEFDLNVEGQRGTRDTSFIKKSKTARQSVAEIKIEKLQSSGLKQKITLQQNHSKNDPASIQIDNVMEDDSEMKVENEDINQAGKTNLSGSQNFSKKNVGEIARGQTLNTELLINAMDNNKQSQSGLLDSMKNQGSQKIGGGGMNSLGGSFQSIRGDLNKSQQIMTRELESFVFIDHESLAFRFKNNSGIEKGQYRIPFIFQLPQRVPGSFNLKHKQKNKEADPENLKIVYTIDCYIEGMRFEMYHEKELQVMQFLFTEEEIDTDLEMQKKILQLQKILNPDNQGDFNIKMINKEELLKAIPENQAEDVKQLFFSTGVEEEKNHQGTPINRLSVPSQLKDEKISPQINESQVKIGSNKFKKQSMFLQSQRIANMKHLKERNDNQKEAFELSQIRSQSIRGLKTQTFQFQSNLQNQSGCLKCFNPHYNISVQTHIDKVLYFNNEIVRLEMRVDNRRSQRKIQNINCYLRQTVKVLKNKNDESKGIFAIEYFDLHRVQINKGNFAEMLKQEKNDPKNTDNKRVYGQFLLEFNLKKIFSQIDELQQITDAKQRSLTIKKYSQATKMTQMQKIGQKQEEEKSAQKRTEESKEISNQMNSVENQDTYQDAKLKRSNSMTNNKPTPFQEDLKSAQEFERQLTKYLDEIEYLTPFTINGMSLSSEFSIAVRIEMEPVGLNVFSGSTESSEEQIPIIIRSQKDADHIHDLMQLQMQELKMLPDKVKEMYPFLDNTFTLAGCNLGLVGSKQEDKKSDRDKGGEFSVNQ